MELRQQIVQDRIDQVANELHETADNAFMVLAQAIITGSSIHALDRNDIIDGTQDKQIDVITIDEQSSQATVYVTQVKNTDSFSSNSLIQMHNGLDWLFNRSRAQIDGLSNQAFKDKITEYRALQSRMGPSNIAMVVAFITNGLTTDLPREFEQEREAILAQYDNGTFDSFNLLVVGADELVTQMNQMERSSRKVDANITIRYDANNPSLLLYHSAGLKGLVCSISAEEIARVVNEDSDGSVFDSNIRRFLGTRGAVNSDILKTCTDTDNHLFWFLNNGITVVCDKFDAITDPDNPTVIIENMQIVNGCQTATTLAMANAEGNLAPDVRVLLRIYETADSNLVDKIVLTTNNQNKIGSRDLRANDPVQLDMERGFNRYSYHYERKNRQYDGVSGVNSRRIVVNETVGQAYLAIVLKKPSDARGRKYRIWGELYPQVFNGRAIEPHVLSTIIYRQTADWLRRSGHTLAEDDILRKAAKNGSLHIARIAAYLLRGNDDWRSDIPQIDSHITSLDSDVQILQPHLEQAIQVLQGIIRNNPRYVSDVDNALKASTIDSDIDRHLYRVIG